MSEYETEYGYAPDEADLEALTAQARQETVEYIAPYLQQQQQQIDALYNNAAAQAAAVHREQEDRDAQIANQAQSIVAAQYPAGWWDDHRYEIAAEISRRPGLLADAALGSDDPRQLADAIYTASQTVQRERAQAEQAEKSRQLDKEIEQMKHPGGFTPWGRIRESQSVDQAMRGR